SAADRINDLLAKRNAQGLRSNVAWDAASYIRAAKAAGSAQYALDAANAIVALEPQWKDTNPAHRFDQCGNPSTGCGPPDNQFANGGWPASVGAFANPGEYGEVDGEAVRAMNSLFNTPAGNGMSITPAQLARITFSGVTAPGQTTVVALDPSSVAPPDARF